MSYFSYNDETERLFCDSIDEAMQEYVDEVDPDKWEKQVKIYRYERLPIPEKQKVWQAERAIENLICSLDEEHGDPNEDGTEITNEMMVAAREFVDKVIAKYVVWGCEAVEEIKVNVADWAEKNLLTHAGDDDEVRVAIARLRGAP